MRSSDPAKKAASNQHASETVDYPGFVVNVSFSQKAEKKLFDSKETVIVAGYLTGTPIHPEKHRHGCDMGDGMSLGDLKAEVQPSQEAKFDSIQIPKKLFEETDQKTPDLLINVYSGRKSSKNNLLECGIFEDSLDAIKDGRINISCKLIYGE
jgi:hypothetical protein